jgi:hypothetical protein
MVCIDMDHPEIIDFIEWKVREEDKARALIAQGYEADFNGEAYKTISGQNANNSVRVTDAFMAAVEMGGTWRTIARTTKATVDEYDARWLWKKGCGVGLCGPGRAVRHDHQPVAHVPEERPHQRVQPLLRVHVPGQLGVQSGLAQPDALHERRRAARPRIVPARGAIVLVGAGDLGGLLLVPDGGDRAQLPSFSSAGAGVREPGHAADVDGFVLRLAAGASRGGRDHGGDDGRGVRHVGGDVGGEGHLRRLRDEPGRDAARDEHASRRGPRD